MTTKREWARYVRVSRVGGRAGDSFVSPELQRAGVDALIKRSGGRPGPEFVDLDRTGGDFNREAIQAAIAWVLEKPTTRGLATYDVSRWARTVSEGLAEIKRLRAAGAVYGSSVQQIDDTPEGNYVLTQWLALAELEAARTGRVWRAVHEARAGRGLPHGTAPLGYHLVEGVVRLNPETSDAVLEVFERYARGETLRRVAGRLSEVRGHHVPTQNAKRTLRNRFYIGEVRYRGEWLPGGHERLVPAELWSRVELRLSAEAGQASARAEPRSFLMGLLKCDGCGGGVQVVNRSRGRGSLACTQFRKRLPADRQCEGFGTPPMEQVEELLVVTLAEAARVEVVERGRGVDGGRVAGLEAEVAGLVAGRGRLTAALARGTLDDDAFDEAVLGLGKELAEARGRLDDARRDEVVVAGIPERGLDVLALLRPDILSPSEARTALREFVKEVRVRRVSDPLPFTRWEGVLTPVWR